MASILGFAHLWQQEELSDVDIVLCADSSAAAHAVQLTSNEEVYRSISAVPEYAGYSLEELRWQQHSKAVAAQAPSAARATVQKQTSSAEKPAAGTDSSNISSNRISTDIAGTDTAQGHGCTASAAMDAAEPSSTVPAAASTDVADDQHPSIRANPTSPGSECAGSNSSSSENSTAAPVAPAVPSRSAVTAEGAQQSPAGKKGGRCGFLRL